MAFRAQATVAKEPWLNTNSPRREGVKMEQTQVEARLGQGPTTMGVSVTCRQGCHVSSTHPHPAMASKPWETFLLPPPISMGHKDS